MNTVNPIEIVNKNNLKSFHYVLILCLFFIMMFDGYDVVIYGATIPLLKAEWGITTIVAGSISSYTTIGTAVGAIVFGLYADRFGKKRIIIFTIFLFSFFFCGYSVGTMTASFSGQLLLERFGWQSVYWIGGVPILLLPLIIRILPVSFSSLIKQKDTEGLVIVLRRIEPKLSKDVQFTYVEQEQLQKSSVRDLFKNKLGLSTMMFWLSCFCTFILMYSLNTWLPTLMMNAGYNLKSSLTFVAVLQIGAILGTLVFGNIIQLLGFKRVLIPLYVVGAASLVLIGYSQNIYIAYGLIALIGAASVGLQNMSNAYVAEYYSVDVRAAALGSTMAFGRMGSIVAPTYMGILLTFNLQPQFNFFAIGIATIFGTIAMSFIREDRADYAVEKQVTSNKVTILKSSTNNL